MHMHTHQEFGIREIMNIWGRECAIWFYKSHWYILHSYGKTSCFTAYTTQIKYELKPDEKN